MALPLPLLERLAREVFASFHITEGAEITTEANPGTLSRETARTLRGIGFNRLSIGVQAWQNHLLKRLGRIHTIEEFLENYRIVREEGFRNVNVDLMFALPGQTLEDTRAGTYFGVQPDFGGRHALLPGMGGRKADNSFRGAGQGDVPFCGGFPCGKRLYAV